MFVEAAVTADYKFCFVSARNVRAMNDSLEFQATELKRIIDEKKLPNWVRIFVDDAYVNGDYIVTPYYESVLSHIQHSFKFYLSSCRMTVEQTIGMLGCRFGILPLRFGLAKDTFVLTVACKLHNFIIDSGGQSYFVSLDVAEEKTIVGVPVVHLQNALYTKQ